MNFVFHVNNKKFLNIINQITTLSCRLTCPLSDDSLIKAHINQIRMPDHFIPSNINRQCTVNIFIAKKTPNHKRSLLSVRTISFKIFVQIEIWSLFPQLFCWSSRSRSCSVFQRSYLINILLCHELWQK